MHVVSARGPRRARKVQLARHTSLVRRRCRLPRPTPAFAFSLARIGNIGVDGGVLRGSIPIELFERERPRRLLARRLWQFGVVCRVWQGKEV